MVDANTSERKHFTFGELRKNDHFKNELSIQTLRELPKFVCERSCKGQILQALKKFGEPFATPINECLFHSFRIVCQTTKMRDP